MHVGRTADMNEEAGASGMINNRIIAKYAAALLPRRKGHLDKVRTCLQLHCCVFLDFNLRYLAALLRLIHDVFTTR
jgi:hypothetical protein